MVTYSNTKVAGLGEIYPAKVPHMGGIWKYEGEF